MRIRNRPVRVMVFDEDPSTFDGKPSKLDGKPSMAEQLRSRLPETGWKVLTAGGDGAMRLMERTAPDIAVLDWNSPGPGGSAVCREIRKFAGDRRHIHILMTADRSDPTDIVRAFEAGADDFLSRPFEPADVIARFHAAVRTICLHRELSRRALRMTRLNRRLASLNARLAQLAMTDDLTGLLNRREATRRLSRAWAMSARYEQPLACALIDIDDFKILNDRCGHAAGDLILRSAAQVMRENLRGSDEACRYGGDEFLLLLPQQDARTAVQAAERIRRAVAATPRPDGAPPVTLSVGICQRGPGVEGFEQMIERADRALYHAKKLGKNLLWIDDGGKRALSA